MPPAAKAFSTARSKLLLALAAGPLLGVVVFLAATRWDGTPAAVPDAGRIPVPWHKSTRLTALDLKWIGPDTVDVLTRRDAKSVVRLFLNGAAGPKREP